MATAELKNPFTGQTVENAKRQYRFDRDPERPGPPVQDSGARPLRRRSRSRLHDDEAGAGWTRVFLPFNKGDGTGAGNPRTRPATRRLTCGRRSGPGPLARHPRPLRPPGGPREEASAAVARSAREAIIFPRYHQLDAVRRLLATFGSVGSGHNYLIEHSAGIGQVNTIAWLAHRLSSLHDPEDKPIFDKVVVITDRVVLDRQLQETIYQFEHAQGVVAKIDDDSAQLAEALSRNADHHHHAPEVPVHPRQGRGESGRRYAVIVDEAHSSQTGEAPRNLKEALGTREQAEKEEGRDEDKRDETEDEVLKAIRVEAGSRTCPSSPSPRRRRPGRRAVRHAATRTAKPRAVPPLLDAPGHRGGLHPRRARELHDLRDLLADREGDRATTPSTRRRRRSAAIARFVTLHPHNLAQKAEIIVEHFREHTATQDRREGEGDGRHRSAGSTPSATSRPSTTTSHDKGYDDIQCPRRVLRHRDRRGRRVHRVGMNGFPERQTAGRGSQAGDYQVLIVAEKFQTGFDQPLLHTMFVDKPLNGLQAVQTLSRLNRIPDKEDTFVLDFGNEPEEIKEAFKPYYERPSRSDRPEPALRAEDNPRRLSVLLAAGGRGFRPGLLQARGEAEAG